MHVLIAGCGWLGQALGRALVARGDRVTGVRRGDAAAELRPFGIEPLRLDLSDWHCHRALPGDVEVVVACQSASGSSIEAYRAAYIDASRTLLEAASRMPLRAFVYTGSTAVFGQRDGSTVDEATPVAPDGPIASLLVEAEGLLLEAVRSGLPARLVRLSGLYGPGRTGAIERVRAGTLALGPGDDVWMNWCHRQDAITAILATIDRGRNGGIYHATDAEPSRLGDVVSFVASRLGIPPPRRARGDPGAPIEPRGSNRRISGEKTRAELDFSLAYPSFREGLAPFLRATPVG